MSDPFGQIIAAEGLQVAPAIRDMHRGGVFDGSADIDHGRGPLVRALLRAAGMPPPGRAVPLRLEIRPDADGAWWTRDFGGHRTHSRLERRAGLVLESFGPFAVAMRLTADADALVITVARGRMLGLPVPGALAPRSTSREWQDSRGRLNFDISATVPFGGLLIRYRGTLVRTG